MGEASLLSVVEEAGIVTLTMCREEAANALSTALLEALQEAVSDLMHRPNTRVVILTAQGEKSFCAGADLRERKGMDAVAVQKAVARIRSVVEGVARLPIPVIAAINGAAFGGGTELALAADIRIAAHHAALGLTETGLAIIPGAGGTQRLPRLIGMAAAKELIYTARRITATEAHAYGLVNHVVPKEHLMEKTRAIAAEISRNGPIAVRQAKFAIDEGANVSLDSGLAIERKAYEVVIPTEDRLEGLAAFAEKRRPNYQGR